SQRAQSDRADRSVSSIILVKDLGTAISMYTTSGWIPFFPSVPGYSVSDFTPSYVYVYQPMEEFFKVLRIKKIVKSTKGGSLIALALIDIIFYQGAAFLTLYPLAPTAEPRRRRRHSAVMRRPGREARACGGAEIWSRCEARVLNGHLRHPGR